MQFGMIVSMIFAVLAVIFAVQNTEIVTLHFFIWSFSLPLAILMILALAIGAVFAAVFTLPGWFRWKRSDRVYKKELTGLEDSLSKYRADLIDTQNKNKDLRQKIFELEEAKDQLEAAQVSADREIKDMQEAIGQAQLSAADAEQARKEAIEARDELDAALKRMEEKMKFSEQKVEIMRTAMEAQAEAPLASAEPAPEPDVAGTEGNADPEATVLPNGWGAEANDAETEDLPDEVEDSDAEAGDEPKEEAKKRFGFW